MTKQNMDININIDIIYAHIKSEYMIHIQLLHTKFKYEFDSSKIKLILRLNGIPARLVYELDKTL